MPADHAFKKTHTREIARVLKAGGHVAIFDVRHSYAAFFERNGFTVVKKWMTMVFGHSVVARKN